MGDVPVTVIVSGRNSATTIKACLDTFCAQDYPIDKILVFDNASTDGSQEIIRSVASSSRVSVELFDGGSCGSISTSYNRGAEMARTDILVLTHSDAFVPTERELRKLVEPLRANPDAATAYPRNLMPRSVWDRFPFWEKFQFVRAVDATSHSSCAIFDAVRRDVFIKAGGFDEKRFTTTCGFGGEDSDAAFRFARFGRRLYTEACIVHAHAFPKEYPFSAYAATRAMLGRTYGKMLQHQGGLVERSDMLLLVRPLLALAPLLGVLFFFVSPLCGICAETVVMLLQLAFAAFHSRKMFTSRQNWRDVRILFVIPAQLAMIYWESFWFFHGLFTRA